MFFFADTQINVDNLAHKLKKLRKKEKSANEVAGTFSLICVK